ncbi:MAG TPA: hypothetical protein P5250_02990 [Bacteroidales bacterium]|nr:hypothetical protein [Bacteroidales bacterium]
MKKIKSNFKKVIFTLTSIGVFLSSASVFAQGGGGPIPPHVLPITGVGALVAAGIVAGIIFFNKKNKKKD